MSQSSLRNAGFSAWGTEHQSGYAGHSIHDYRQRAARLRALASESPDAQIRAYLLTTAAQFERLADYAAASGANSDAA